MKRNILFAVLMSGIMLVSCSGKAKTELNPIVGKWESQSITTDIKTSDSVATAKITVYLNELVKDIPDSIAIEFTNDGKVNNSIDYNGTYSVSDDEISITYFNKTHYRCKFQIKGDTLLIFDRLDNMIDENLRRELDVSNSVKIEKATSIMSLIRKK